MKVNLNLFLIGMVGLMESAVAGPSVVFELNTRVPVCQDSDTNQVYRISYDSLWLQIGRAMKDCAV